MTSAIERHARLTALFGDALELAPADRGVLIARVAADDPALAAELQTLLAADASDGTELRTGIPTLFERPVDRAPPPLAIPGYRMLGAIGAGGMGTVYAAEQGTPRRRVAIKVLHGRSAGALARFYAEAEIMARLDHPNIARVLEAGVADGHPFLVMEHVDGATLDAFVAAVDPPRAQRLELIAAIADAVHHSHLHGVIHRDLKPSNVMVRDDGKITVLDFGVARITAIGGDDGDGAPRATQAGELIGTPVYMSPEQARLRPHEVDARSDVYSLGVVLFELITDELPYDVRGQPLPEVSRVICEVAPRALGGDAPRDLEAIVGKALAKDPAERYQSAAALADDVRHHARGLPVSARTPSTLEQVRRFVRRRPGAAAVGAAAVVGTIAFAAIVTTLWLEARAARRSADVARDSAETARVTAETARDDLATRTDQLTLRQARAALVRDPSDALAWLRTLSATGVDPDAAWLIADEARGRGVARDVLRGHDDEAHWVDGLPDGGAVSAGYDGRVLVWAAAQPTSREVYRSAHRVHVARPSPDGTRLAIGGDGGELVIVPTAGGAASARVGHAGNVGRAEWSRDGRWLVTGDDRGAVWLWPGGDAPGRALAGPSAAIESLAFSDDDRAVVGGDARGAIWRWRVAAGEGGAADAGAGAAAAPLATVDGSAFAVWTDGARVIAADATGTVSRWQLAGDRAGPRRATATGEPCKHAAIAANGADVVLGGVSGTITRVDLRAADLGGAAGGAGTIDRLPFAGQLVRAVAISATGTRLAVGDDDGVVQLWDRATGRHLALLGHSQRIRHLAFAAGDDELLSADREGLVRRWDLRDVPPRVLDGHRTAVVQLAASADGTRLASVGADGTIWSWNLATGGGRPIGQIAGRVEALAVAGDAVITGTADGEVAWWGPHPSSRRVRGIVRAIVVDAAGDRVAVASHDGPITIFDGDGASIAELVGHARGTESLAFAPTGDLLASGGMDRAVRLWHVGGGAGGAAPAPAGSLDGTTGNLRVVAFAPRGELLVAAGNDGAVRAWTVRDGAVDASSLRVLATHTAVVTAIGFDVGARWLVSAGRDHRLVRIALDGRTPPDRSSADIALAVAVGPDGAIETATASSGVDTWWPPAAPTAAIDRDVRAALALAVPDARLVLGMADGTIVVSAVRHHTLAELRAAIAP